jgi:hypothetical protein
VIVVISVDLISDSLSQGELLLLVAVVFTSQLVSLQCRPWFDARMALVLPTMMRGVRLV